MQRMQQQIAALQRALFLRGPVENHGARPRVATETQSQQNFTRVGLPEHHDGVSRTPSHPEFSRLNNVTHLANESSAQAQEVQPVPSLRNFADCYETGDSGHEILFPWQPPSWRRSAGQMSGGHDSVNVHAITTDDSSMALFPHEIAELHRIDGKTFVTQERLQQFGGRAAR